VRSERAGIAGIAVVFGTRPEIIKLAPLFRELRRSRTRHRTIHTGQHYSWNMDRVFFEQLGLPEPDSRLEVGSGTQGAQTSRLLSRIEEDLLATRPALVLVQGDTNSTLAGALAASKLGIPVAHVEAGMRTFDRRMPEEVNRVVADHLSTILFAPTALAVRNLRAEGLPSERIFLTGNTSIDALRENLAHLHEGDRAAHAALLRFGTKGYIIMTLHRQENVDRRETLREIIQGVSRAARRLDLPVLWPVHPRTSKMLKRFRLHMPRGIIRLPPAGYFEFLELERRARLVITDSGGVQEEACVLRVPCVTVWESETCWIETVRVGANLRVRPSADGIERAAMRMACRRPTWRNPYGEGGASARIVRILRRSLRG